MESSAIFAALKTKFGEAAIDLNEDGPEAFAMVPSELIPDVCQHLRDAPEFDCDLFSCLTGVDLKGLKGETDDGFEVIYNIESTGKAHCVSLRTRVAREKPEIPSVSSIWETADWHERESFDLLGIVFTGHPNLVRILCADDWIGYPLRKDYEFPTEYHGIVCEFEGNEDGTWGGHPG